MQATVNDFMQCYDESEQKDGNTNNLLYKEIVNIIAETQKEGNAPKRIEPDGIHFIEQGDIVAAKPHTLGRSTTNPFLRG